MIKITKKHEKAIRKAACLNADVHGYLWMVKYFKKVKNDSLLDILEADITLDELEKFRKVKRAK